MEQEKAAQERLWAERALLMLRSLLPLMGAVSSWPGWTPQQKRTIAEMLTASAMSSESVLLLIAYDQVWDAELPLRAVVEGSLKFAYLLQSRASFTERHREYSHDLFRISLLKDHHKAQETLSALMSLGSSDLRPLEDRLLTNDQVAEIKLSQAWRDRRELERRWGFTCLLQSLAHSGDLLFRGVGALAHGYSIASHLVHADSTGTSIVLERAYRSVQRREALHSAHAARVIADVLSCFLIRLGVGYRFSDVPSEKMAPAFQQVNEFLSDLAPAYTIWEKIEYGSTATDNHQ